MFLPVVVALVHFGSNSAIGHHQPDRHQPRDVHFRYVRDEDCRNEIIRLMDGLTNNLPWAVRMHRSSSGYPTGLMHGNNYQLGDYDQCINAISPDGIVRGKYCLVEIRFSPEGISDPRDPVSDEFNNPYMPYLNKLLVTPDRSKKPRNVIHTGVCLPESCSPDDVSDLGFIPSYKFGRNRTIHFSPNSCSNIKTSTIGEKIVWGVIAVLANLALLSTILDIIFDGSKNKLLIVMEPFSLKRNLRKLTKATENEELNAFHGMKTLSMFLIILGHRCKASLGGPVFNADFLEEGYRSFPAIFLLNGFLIVDTFFLIGGFLTFLTLRQAYNKGTAVSTFTVLFNRWLRITPGYAITVFFYGYVLENLGSGPLWSAKVGREAERCRLNWWTNFLYVNNFVNVDKLCMFQSWYIACDMHFTMISPTVVALVVYFRKNALAILFGTIALFSAITSTVTYVNKYDGVMKIYHSTFEDLASDSSFTDMYIKSQYRIIPFLSGMTAGHIYLHLKEFDIQIKKIIVWVSSIGAFIFGVLSICGAWIFYIPGREYNAMENAVYASLHRVLWSLSMGWVAVACSRKSFGRLQPILTTKAFLPLSRLSFGTFLVHGVVQLYTSASIRQPEYISYTKLFWMTSGDIVLSFSFALLLHLLVEAPMKGIQQLLFAKSVSKKGCD